MKKIYLHLSAICVVMLLCAAAEVSQASPAVNEFRLANGMRVLHVERKNLPIVTMSILIKASPRNEPPERAGLAYLTAKLLADGTTTKKGPEISEAIEYLGASFSTSATADFTLLAYSSLKKDAEAGMAIVSDVLMNPVFAEEELARKKTMTKGMLRQREEDPQYVANKRFLKEVFGSPHPYGRPVEGEAATLDAVSRADIGDFYARFYRPDRAVITLVGDLSAAEARQLTERFFSAWKARSEAPVTTTPSGVPKTVAKQLIIDRNLTQASIVLGHEGISRSNPDYYAVQVMNYVLGSGGFASRLMQVVRDDMGLAYSIYSSFSANEEPGHFLVDVQTKNASAATVVAEVERQIRRMRAELIADSELNDAKAYLTGSFPRRLETSKKIAELVASADFFGLGTDYIRNYPSYINRITKEDVLRTARKYLDPVRLVLVIVGKESELTLPDAQPLK
ncbi:MAG: processing peptidase [Nitrospirae bacterium]|nr:MAG: processing peptidase [Nitrospirota bacterium]